ncbi:MAG: CPBP family intramembrane glutamic endopeptidase [Bacteroidia bacterium]|nr:CPBP family intramembrane metalloprotease [Bacteroidia bacterium]MDW8015871.1 CPBP family intramembrane glutamic endopeptidase [Bacteroidia bacterium]
MREGLRLGALLGLLGLMLLLATAVLVWGGMGGASPLTDAESVHRTAAGNALTLLIGFGGAGLIFLLVSGKDGRILLYKWQAPLSIYGWIALFMGGLFLVLPWLGLDAESFRLPASLSHWERFLEEQEARIETLIYAFIEHGSLPLLLLYMGVAPAVAEELFFRGALQLQLGRLFKRSHLALWLSAFLFSLVHFQVYGFIPRLLLGAAMGYLTLWTGRLFPAIWAHFLNNAYATITAYVGMHFFHHPEWISSTYRPPLWLALSGAFIAGLAGYQLYNRLFRA